MPKPMEPGASVKSGVLLAPPAEPLASCLDRMAEANVGSILIVEDSRPVGIMTERDLLKHWRTITAPAGHGTSIGQLFSKPVLTLTIDDIAKAPALMVERRIRHVPLVDAHGVVVGIVSMRDILAAQLKANQLPHLKAVPRAKAKDLPPCMLHMLTPTAQLAQIGHSFLAENWTSHIWQSVDAMESSLEHPGAIPLERTAYLLDLDGLVAFTDWRPLLRRFIKLLARAQQPALFLVFSPAHFSDGEAQSLRQVAAKAHWHAYQRPLPVQALAHDLWSLNETLAIQP